MITTQNDMEKKIEGIRNYIIAETIERGVSGPSKNYDKMFTNSVKFILSLFADQNKSILQQAITLATSRHQVVGRKDTYYIELEQLERILEGKEK